MTGLLIACILLGVVWRWRRRNRQEMLSGRVGDRPTYSIEPPPRRVGVRKTEAL